MQDIKDIKADVKEIKENIAEIKETLAINTTSLSHHMQRTELNERRIQTLEYWLLGFMAAILVAVLKLFL